MNKIGNFFHTVFVKAVWQTFCVKWVWETFCVAWIYQAFWKELIVKKLQFEKWKGWVYLFPVIVLIAIFTVWPIINTVRIAFLDGYQQSLANAHKFGGEKVVFNVGIQNFVDVISGDADFLTALKNTILLCVLTVPISTALALLIAVCLNAIKPLQKFLQTIHPYH